LIEQNKIKIQKLVKNLTIVKRKRTFLVKQVGEDGVIMYTGTSADKQMPDSMCKWYDSVRLEEQDSTHEESPAYCKFKQTTSVHLSISRI